MTERGTACVTDRNDSVYTQPVFHQSREMDTSKYDSLPDSKSHICLRQKSLERQRSIKKTLKVTHQFLLSILPGFVLWT